MKAAWKTIVDDLVGTINSEFCELHSRDKVEYNVLLQITGDRPYKYDKNDVYYLTDRREGVTFASITKRPSEELFVITILRHSTQSTASNACKNT